MEGGIAVSPTELLRKNVPKFFLFQVAEVAIVSDKKLSK